MGRISNYPAKRGFFFESFESLVSRVCWDMKEINHSFSLNTTTKLLRSERSILLLPEMRLHEVPLTTWLTDHMIIVTLVTSQRGWFVLYAPFFPGRQKKEYERITFLAKWYMKAYGVGARGRGAKPSRINICWVHLLREEIYHHPLLDFKDKEQVKRTSWPRTFPADNIAQSFFCRRSWWVEAST